MKICLDIKYNKYKYIKKIIKCCKNNNVMLVHYENTRGKGQAYWGAVIKNNNLIGNNELGKLWMEFYKC